MDIKNLYNKDKWEIVKTLNSTEFQNEYKYDGELGAIYSKEKTTFKVWSPVSKKAFVKFYDKNGVIFQVEEMREEEKGLFTFTKEGDLDGVFYRYAFDINNSSTEACDIYSKAVSLNGEFSVVVDLKSTDPKGFNEDIKPDLNSPLDSIIYEMHVRDFTIDKTSGVLNKGKFLGLIEDETKYNSVKTGLDHLKELGITHVHLLPVFDYKSVDESKFDTNDYNWGYDPDNFNSIEGSYSTSPNDFKSRIKEFKEAVLKLHESGIRVVMDVVYNHTFEGDNSNFNKTFPMYYYREWDDGSFSNGSACGNETASDRYMFRKYMIDSVKYYAKEYHIDGFRFDLMGLHDVDTMKEIREELDKIDKSILMYGEGWTGGNTPLREDLRALKVNTPKYGKMQIAAFSDDIRDGVKGDVFNSYARGFASGGEGFEETIKCGIVASTNHSEIDYNRVIYSNGPWANEPYQTITYNSAHDNYTLFDKLTISSGSSKEEEVIKMNKLIANITLTSNGIAFLHSGEEFLRTKKDLSGNIIENSYNSPDCVNKIDWARKEKYQDVFNHYKGLIKLRKKYKEFRLESAEDINNKIRFQDTGIRNLIYYKINGEKNLICIHNGNKENKVVKIDDGSYKILLDHKGIYKDNVHFVGKFIEVSGRSSVILEKIDK
ncbi:MAG: type I pullulanase [Clostridium chrysemydis]|uniref:type I pullulanase n=1 Tax=Clostridium chrysemydis TaxID=2665504 RepID=UPI003F2B25DB